MPLSIVSSELLPAILDWLGFCLFVFPAFLPLVVSSSNKNEEKNSSKKRNASHLLRKQVIMPQCLPPFEATQVPALRGGSNEQHEL